MKTLAQNFLTADEQQRITRAVHRAEQMTSGEIVPMLISRSSDYPAATFLGGFLPGFVLALLITPIIGRFLWLGSNNMLLFVACFFLLFFLFFHLTERLPTIKRLFLLHGEARKQVEKQALASFFQEGLYQTSQDNGILLLVSVLEQQVVILGDRGIDEKVPPGCWQQTVEQVTQGIRRGEQCHAICQAIDRIGALLQDHFPIREDDTNELHDLIIH